MTRTLAIAMVMIATLQAEAPYVGRPLLEVLGELQAGGLKIVYSSELVGPELRVTAEPRARSPRRILDEILNPHGLEVRNGPNGSLLVVRAARRRNNSRPAASASVGSLSGRVVDAKTGTPLADVHVEVQSSGHTARTDGGGAFALINVPAGRQSLFVSTIGYALARPDVEVSPGTDTEITIPLSEGTGAYTERVNVTAETAPAPAAAAPSLQTLGSAALQSVRMVLVDDPLRAIQALPGVAANDDFRSDFSLRGADFAHVGLSIDGVASPWLLHGFEHTEDSGSMAMLNSDILDRLTLSSGSYPQKYGDRIGGWLEADMREGSRQATGIRVAVSGTNASLMAEGPVGSSRKGSWLVSIRRSYIDWLVRQVVPDFSDSIFGFTDVQSKLVYDVTPRHQLQMTSIVGISRLRQDNETHPLALSHAADDLGIVTVALRSTVSPTLILTQRVSGVAQRFRNLNPYDAESAKGRVHDLSYRADVTWMTRHSTIVEAGAQYEGQHARRDIHEYRFASNGITPVLSYEASFSASTQLPAMYARVVVNPQSKFSFSPGIRIARSSVVRETVTSPWLQATLAISRTLSLKAGTGLYHQFPELHQTHGPHAGVNLQSERARHADVALEHRMSPSMRWQLTLYSRHDERFLRLDQSDIRIVNGRLVFPSSTGPWYNGLAGDAYGAEALIQRASPVGLSGWVSYAVGRTRYEDHRTGERFDGDFDQRHTMNAFLQYAISSRTSVSGKLRTGSNFPMQGYWRSNGGRVFVGDTLNQVRVPAYSRLDLRVNRVFNYTSRRLTLFAEIMNVLNHDNARFHSPDGIDGRTGEAVDYLQNLFPRMPSAGILFEF